MTGTHRWTRLSAILLTLAVLLTACGGNDETAEDTTTTTERAPTTEPEAATSTTEPADEPPELENTGEDFVAIMQSIREYSNWLYQNPNPTLLEAYTYPVCSCFEAERTKLEILEANSWRLDGPQGKYDELEVVAQDNPDSVGVAGVAIPLTLTVVDDKGQRVETQDELPPPTRFLVTLQRDEGHWRIYDSQVLGPAEEGQ